MAPKRSATAAFDRKICKICGKNGFANDAAVRSHLRQTPCGVETARRSAPNPVSQARRERRQRSRSHSPASEDFDSDAEHTGPYQTPHFPTPAPEFPSGEDSDSGHPAKRQRVTIEDVPEPKEEICIEDYPTAGYVIEERGVVETMFARIKQERIAAGKDVWAPFGTKKEWDLAKWLMTCGISQKEVENFLKLSTTVDDIKPSFKNKRSLLNKIDSLPGGPGWRVEPFDITGTVLDEKKQPKQIEVELWKRNPVDCIKELMQNPRFEKHMRYAPERIWHRDADGKEERGYDEMATAEWWWAVQQLLKEGATIAPCIISSDKTQLSHFSGDKSAWPVYLTIGNIDFDLRRKPSEHAQILIGYIPVVKLDIFDEKERALQGYSLFHQCMEALLKPLIQAGKDGVEMLCADGRTRLVFPILAAYVADYPEQCLVACCMENRCPKCTAKRDEMGNGPKHDPLRDVKTTLDVLQSVANGYQPDAYTLLGLRSVKPFWQNLPHCDIFSCFTPDILHQLHKGVFKDHMVKWSTEASDVSKADIDKRFQALPRNVNLRHFTKGVSFVTQWTGTEYKEMEKVFLTVLAGTASNKVVTCVRAVLEFIHYAHFEHHTDSSLKEMDNALRTFHETKHIFIDDGIRTHFNIPKIHSMLHYVPMIRSRGVASGFNTEATERLHIDFAKLGYRASSKKGYIKQMTRWLTRRENIERFQSFLQWALEGEGRDVKRDDDDEEEEDADVDDEEKEQEERPKKDDQSAERGSHEPEQITSVLLSHGESKYAVAKVAPFKNVSLNTLIDEYHCTDFPQAMADFLQSHLILDAVSYWNSTPALYSLFKRVRVTVPSVAEVSRHVTIDSIRANISQEKTLRTAYVPAQFDTVLAWKKLPNNKDVPLDLIGPNGLHVGRVRAIFAMPPSLAAGKSFPHPLAYVEWFKPIKMNHLDGPTNMFKVTPLNVRRLNNPVREASIIPVTYISRTCHLVPISKQKAGQVLAYSSETALDVGKTFLLNSHYRHLDFVLLSYKRNVQEQSQ